MTRARAKSYNHIIKYTGIFGGVEVLKILIGLVRNKLVAILLGPNGMGLMSLFNSTVKFMSDSTTMGIPTSAVRELSQMAEEGDRLRLERTVSTVRTLSMIAALMGMVLCACLGPLLNRGTFTWGNHTLHYVLLSPVVGLMAVSGGELAILKGMRQLRDLARLSVYGVVVALVVAVPLFYFWGESAIVPVLFFTELIQLLLITNRSFRLFPLRLSRLGTVWSDGRGMLMLGLAFVVSGILVSGADFLIRAYLSKMDSLVAVGLFNAGFVIVSVYAGMVFSAMGTDYYPRLSAVGSEGRELNMVVSEQIEVSVLLVAPLLVLLMVLMPVILPLLYSHEFEPVVAMVQVSLLSMYFRAVYIPIEYIALARSRAWVFLLQELVGTGLLIACVIGGYEWNGLWGAGLGLTVAYLLETLFVLVLSHVVFGYVMSLRALRYLVLQLTIGIAAFIATLTTADWAYWLSGLLCCLLSAGYSLQVLRQNAAVLGYLKRKFLRR